MEPPPSVPTAAEQIPDATIAAGPEDDPPVYLSTECGFLVVLWMRSITKQQLVIAQVNQYILLRENFKKVEQ